MSNSRQDDSTLIRTFGVTLSHSQLVPPISVEWDQFVYAGRGVLTLRTESQLQVVPPCRGVWLPANSKIKLEVSGLTALRMLYLHESLHSESAQFDRSRSEVLNVSPLLRELILRAVKIGALRADLPNHRRMAELILDELSTAPTVALQLPMPQSAFALRFAESLGEYEYNLDQAAPACGASRRTLERTFQAETKLSLGQWVRRRRLVEAIRLLGEGRKTSDVAFELGYSTPSAFIAMFRRELGSTPGEYLAS